MEIIVLQNLLKTKEIPANVTETLRLEGLDSALTLLLDQKLISPIAAVSSFIDSIWHNHKFIPQKLVTALWEKGQHRLAVYTYVQAKTAGSTPERIPEGMCKKLYDIGVCANISM